MHPHRTRYIVILGVLFFFFTNGVTNGIVESIPTKLSANTQINALNDLLVVDGILFGFLGILANQDYERYMKRVEAQRQGQDSDNMLLRGARSFLKGDVLIAILLIASAIAAIFSVVRSDTVVSPWTIGIPLDPLILALSTLLIRLIDLAWLA